jgi:hypothetical protein
MIGKPIADVKHFLPLKYNIRHGKKHTGYKEPTWKMHMKMVFSEP